MKIEHGPGLIPAGRIFHGATMRNLSTFGATKRARQATCSGVRCVSFHAAVFA